MKGLFITFEGPDGAGKTTQIQLLSQYLEAEGIPYVATREPGGTFISDKIREIILDPEHRAMANETEVLLYAASRAQHVREKIIPALKEGKVVLCDRFVDASIAYQGYGLGIDIATVRKINSFATESLSPNRTYLIDLAPEMGRNRMKKRSEIDSGELDRIEQKELEYHQRVRAGFHAIYEAEKDRMVLMDGSLEVNELQDLIIQDFQSFWKSAATQ